MRRRQRRDAPSSVAGSAYGIGLVLEASDRALLTAMVECAPPAWTEGPPPSEARRFSLISEGADQYSLRRDGRTLLLGSQEAVVEELERNIRMQLAYNAPAHFFLHAGAVAWQGAGIVVAGSTFSGKTTLVRALVAAGAVYYSDENAVVDTSGALHPYPKPLGLRLTEGLSLQTPHNVSELGGVSGVEPLPIALVVAAEYRPGAQWAPSELSPAEILQVLLKHTFRGLDRPAESLQAMNRAADGALGLTGDRGEATQTAALLIDALGRRLSTAPAV